MSDTGKGDLGERDWMRALVWLAALAVLVIIVAGAFVAPALLCGCTQPPPSMVP